MWQEFTADGALRYPNFLETVVRLAPMYALRAGRRHAVHRRRARRGLQPVPDGAAGRASSPARRRRRRRFSRDAARRRSRPGIARSKSRPVQFAVLTFVAVVDRRRRRVRADGARPLERPDHRVGQAVHAARDRRARPLHPRRLRRLPFADGAAAARRNRALRRLLEGRRVRLRPSVPVGLEAHRAGPASRRRQVSGLVALRAHEAAARDLAGLDHAGLPVALRRASSTRRHIEGKIITLRRLGVPVSRRLRAPGRSRSAARRRRAIADGLTRGGLAHAAPTARSSPSSPTSSASAPTSRPGRRVGDNHFDEEAS